MDGSRQCYEAAHAAIPVALQSFDASAITKSIYGFPVLRLHACNLLCAGDLNIVNAVKSKDCVDKVCKVVGAILESCGKRSEQLEYCARQISNLMNGKNEVLIKLVSHMLKSYRFHEGCGLFVLRFLESVLLQGKDADKGLRSFVARITISPLATESMPCGSYWSKVGRLLSKEQGRNEAKLSAVKHKANENAEFLRSNTTLRRPKLFADGPEQCALEKNLANSSGRVRNPAHTDTCMLSEEDTHNLLKIIATHAARPDHLERLISVHRTAPVLIDMLAIFLYESLTPGHGYRNAMSEARIHAASLLLRLVTITERDPSTGQHCVLHPVLHFKSYEGVERRSINSEDFNDHLHRTCVAVSKNGRLNVMNISTVTKHLVRLHLSLLSENFIAGTERFKLQSWMSVADVADAAFASLSGDPSSLRTVLAFWRELGSCSESKDRMEEVDSSFVSRLATREEICFWLSNCSTGALVGPSRTIRDVDHHTEGKRLTPRSYALSPIFPELISLAKSAASRRKRYVGTTGDKLAILISVLQDRLLWDVNRESRRRVTKMRSVLHLLDDVWNLKEWLCSSYLTDNSYNAASLKQSIAVCTCGRVFRGKRCGCPMVKWRRFTPPEIRRWFMWIALESGLIESSSSYASGQLDDTVLQAICNNEGKTDGKEHKKLLFREMCTAIFNAYIHTGKYVAGHSELQKMPAEFQYVLREALLDEELSRKNSVLLQETMKGVQESSASKLLSTGSSESLRSRRSLRCVIDFLLKWSFRIRDDGLRGGETAEDCYTLERFLRLVYPTISEMIARMADMPTVTRYVKMVAACMPRMLAVSKMETGYICILLSYNSRQADSDDGLDVDLIDV